MKESLSVSYIRQLENRQLVANIGSSEVRMSEVLS